MIGYSAILDLISKMKLNLFRLLIPINIQFPDLFFFIPEIIVELNANKISIGLFGSTSRNKFSNRYSRRFLVPVITEKKTIRIQSRFSRKEYIDIVEKLRQHILRGDCYEINFCQEFFAENYY